MNIAQIRQLLAANAYPEHTNAVKLVETHASWVLLTDQYAYKVKKPVKFSFLDFSTLEKRHFYCHRELQLNTRLAPEMYLSVVPIVQVDEHLLVDGAGGALIDYALKMKRMDNEREMQDLLKQNAVTPKDMEQLAEKVADFHRHATKITTPVDLQELQDNFANMLRMKSFLSNHLKQETVQVLETAVEKAKLFLNQHVDRLKERGRSGFSIDGHGDLHSGNIFLLKEPVIFDCIEFNDSFRRLDMLDEVAFLCLDLDYYNRPDLQDHFLQHYLAKMPCLRDAEDHQIFQYYKLYRANVRLKVTFLKAKQQQEASAAFYKELAVAKKYFDLFEHYLSLLIS